MDYTFKEFNEKYKVNVSMGLGCMELVREIDKAGIGGCFGTYTSERVAKEAVNKNENERIINIENRLYIITRGGK